MIKTIAAIVLALSLAVAGCGGSDSGGGYGAGNEESSGAATKATSGESSGGRYGAGSSGKAAAGGGVSVADVPGAGKVLVDSKGYTLYLFEKDEGGKSACYGACAKVWPPLMTDGAPRATGGARASQLGTTRRSDGGVQVTYAGWPLYTYAADTKPGDDKGNDIDSFGAEWYPLTASGEKPED